MRAQASVSAAKVAFTAPDPCLTLLGAKWPASKVKVNYTFNLARFNCTHYSIGDLIYPIFTVGFFLLGVIVVVKVLLWILSLFKAKLLYAFVPRSADEIFDRKRRSADSPVDQIKLDGLTSVVMTALEAQEW